MCDRRVGGVLRMRLQVEIVGIDFPEELLPLEVNRSEVMLAPRIIVRQMSWAHSSEVEDLTFLSRAGGRSS